MDKTTIEGWTNPAVDVDVLPDYRVLELEGVAAAWPRYTVLTTALLVLPTLAAAGITGWLLDDAPLWLRAMLPGIVLVIGLSVGAWRWMDAGRRGWALREHDIVARAGVLWRATTVLPIARIQHVESSHGPIERWYSLARLKLFTAGGLTADLVLPGLQRERADQLREYLAEQIRLRDSSDDSVDDSTGNSTGEPTARAHD